MEQSWQLDHEDLPARYAALNDSGGAQSGDGQHGVAVLGEIVAKSDSHGVTGIAHEGKFNIAPVNRNRSSGAWFWEKNWTERNVAEAITVAASKLRRGDVILIEQRYPSGKASGTCPAACGNCSQFGYVAMEYFLPEYIAMRLATARGIHVVEAAGNGGMDLDDPRYEQRFSRNFRDSETILVGASDAALAPECWSNFGSRVDVHAWGRNIMTLGYGDQKVTGAPPAGQEAVVHAHLRRHLRRVADRDGRGDGDRRRTESRGADPAVTSPDARAARRYRHRPGGVRAALGHAGHDAKHRSVAGPQARARPPGPAGCYRRHGLGRRRRQPLSRAAPGRAHRLEREGERHAA